MNGAEGTSAAPTDRSSLADPNLVIVELFQGWLDLTDKWMEWERREIISGQPSEILLAKHRIDLTWLLRVVRMNCALAKDPDYPFPRLARELEGRLLQLEDSWRLIHGQTMTEAEADQALKTAFPDER